MNPTTGSLAIRLLRPFVIGAVAGSSPFLFTNVLPVLMHPDLPQQQVHWVPLALVAVGVGAIACIIFNDRPAVSCQDVFMKSLGIPALLVGTYTNIERTAQQDRSLEAISAIVNSVPELTVIDRDSTPPVSDQSSTDDRIGISGTEPSAGTALFTSVRRAGDTLPSFGRTSFLVVIGTYSDQATAASNREKLGKQKLRTERYEPKALEVLRLPDGSSWVLAYSRHATREDAVRVYRLVRINDPELPARILEWHESPDPTDTWIRVTVGLDPTQEAANARSPRSAPGSAGRLGV